MLSAEYVSFSPRLFEHLKSVVDMHILFEKLTPIRLNLRKLCSAFVLEMYPLITCRLKVQCESIECMTAYSNLILNPND